MRTLSCLTKLVASSQGCYKCMSCVTLGVHSRLPTWWASTSNKSITKRIIFLFITNNKRIIYIIDDKRERISMSINFKNFEFKMQNTCSLTYYGNIISYLKPKDVKWQYAKWNVLIIIYIVFNWRDGGTKYLV